MDFNVMGKNIAIRRVLTVTNLIISMLYRDWYNLNSRSRSGLQLNSTSGLGLVSIVTVG